MTSRERLREVTPESNEAEESTRSELNLSVEVTAVASRVREGREGHCRWHKPVGYGHFMEKEGSA